MNIDIGATKRTNIINADKKYPFNEPPCAISLKTLYLPNFQPIKMAINKPPSGSNMLAEIKSSRSKKLKHIKV